MDLHCKPLARRLHPRVIQTWRIMQSMTKSCNLHYVKNLMTLMGATTKFRRFGQSIWWETWEELEQEEVWVWRGVVSGKWVLIKFVGLQKPIETLTFSVAGCRCEFGRPQTFVLWKENEITWLAAKLKRVTQYWKCYHYSNPTPWIFFQDEN